MMAWKNELYYVECEDWHDACHCKFCRFDGKCLVQERFDEDERLRKLREERRVNDGRRISV